MLARNPPSRTWRIRLEETFNIWNAAEDWRIEHHVARQWPGTRANLEHVRAHINAREWAAMEAHPERLLDPFTTAPAVFTWLNAVSNGYRCAPIAERTLALARATNPDLYDLVTSFWPSVLATRDLDDAAANKAIYETAETLCDRLIAVYVDGEAPERKPGQQPGETGTSPHKSPADGEGEGTGDGGDGDPTADGSRETKQAGNPGQSPPRHGGDRRDRGDAENGHDAGIGTDEHARADATRESRAKAAQHEPAVRPQIDIDDVVRRFGEVSGRIAGLGSEAAIPSDSSGMIRIPRPSGPGDVATYQEARTQMLGITSALGASLRALVIAKDRRRTSYSREDGEFDMSNVVGLALRATDVYSRTTVHKGENAAILVALDISDSMRNKDHGRRQRRIDLGIQALVALAEALSASRRVSTAYEAYTTDTEIGEPRVHSLKTFRESIVAARANIGNLIRDIRISQVVMGGTPTGEMMIDAWERLRLRPEPRRILMILTDGEPNDTDLANRAGRTIKAEGGIVVGIAVSGTSPKFDLDHWVMVPEIEELPERVMSAIRHLIGTKQ